MRNTIRKELILLLLFFSIFNLAKSDNKSFNARTAALGEITSVWKDESAIFNNQAGISYLTAPVLSIYYHNRFNMDETGYGAIGFALPVKPGTFSFALSSFGYNIYNENTLSFGFGKKLGKYFSVGVSVNYLSTLIANNYKNVNGISANIGIISEPIKNLRIGFHVNNPFYIKYLNSSDEIIPVIFTLGALYKAADKLFLAYEFKKSVKHDTEHKFAIEYMALDHFFIRSGININLAEYSFGLGYLYKNLKCDLAFSRHQVLGYSPHISLSYMF